MPVRTVAGRELKHPAYVCTARDLWPKDLDELTKSQQEDLDRYLKDFAKPIRNIADEVSCLACGKQLTARTEKTAQQIGQTVEANPDTGEGRCINCGYPLRALHQMFSRTGQLLVKLSGFPLMYHPNSTQRG
jgi:hypothetical protein